MLVGVLLLFAAGAPSVRSPHALIRVHSASDRGEETVGSMAFTTAMAREAASYDVLPAIIGKLSKRCWSAQPGDAWTPCFDGVVTIDTANTRGHRLHPLVR